MGGERSPREKRRSRKRSDDSASSDDGGRGKRHRGSEKDEEKSRRSDKEKRKDRKSLKHRSDKEKKSKDKHKKKHRKGDSRAKNGGFPELSGEDYFSKNNEFAAWLKEEKGTYFADLTSESARELFSGFVKAWNRGRLEPRYYEGITSAPRTAHNWKIKQ
ncbi:PREDICTED: luc7-like protein 3 [Tarenaya hassleriana]|uniref:luc7-like protein 3 n=1 Tax=Tarenaya hassleriana TaxID=28532 RepID=UPI0008FCFDEA|nr:PREDICTED: luc7-like protein 3 [Tarenaya hassleriana]